MKAITKYQSDDGTIFSTEAECLKHESLSREIKVLADQLPIRPDNSDFGNGHGYIQHTPAGLMAFKTELVAIVIREKIWIPEEKVDISQVNPLGIVGRLIDDSDIRPLYSAWYRLMCTDQKNREWGRPYYALHPGTGSGGALNEVTK